MQSEILRIKDIMRVTGLSRTSIWRYIKTGSFPQPVALGGPGSRAVGWYACEVQHYLDSRPRKTGEVGKPQAA